MLEAKHDKKNTVSCVTHLHVRTMPGCTIDKWGPGTWNTMHCFAHSAPQELNQEEQERFRHLLLLIAEHLPCPSCRRHFRAYLETHLNEGVLASRQTLVSFLNDAHNSVNLRLGKRVYTLDEHYRAYARRRPVLVPVEALLFVGLLAVFICVRRSRKIIVER